MAGLKVRTLLLSSLSSFAEVTGGGDDLYVAEILVKCPQLLWPVGDGG